MQAIVDLTRPVQVGQVDIAVSGLVELLLQRLARVEAVHGGPVTAARDVLVDVLLRKSGIWQVGWRVEALAEVKDVGGVEVVEAKVFGEGVEAIVDLVLDRVGDVVYEGDEGVVAI